MHIWRDEESLRADRRIGAARPTRTYRSQNVQVWLAAQDVRRSHHSRVSRIQVDQLALREPPLKRMTLAAGDR